MKKRDMMCEILRLAPQIIKVSYEIWNPTYEEVRECLVWARRMLKKMEAIGKKKKEN